MKAIVAGAGVGGLTAALALCRRGIDVEVVEAAPSTRVSGGGLGLASNATRVLGLLGVDPVAAGVGRVCERFTVRTPDGRLMREMPIGAVARELGSPVVNIRRRDLIGLLREALPGVPVHHDARALGHHTDADGGVRLRLADGRVLAGDVLVGADGIHSAVRARLHGRVPVTEHGYDCWIAAVPFRHPSLPPGGAAHYWGRGRRFGLIDVGRGEVYWWATRNTAGESVRDTAHRDELLRAFAGWAPEVLEVVAATPEADIVRVPAQDRLFDPAWGRGPVTLLGDAAHPMLTSLSQGAGSAIEDAYVLAHHLAGAAPEEGLRGYERARRDRTRRLVSASRRLSRTEQFEHPLAVGLRDLVIRHAPDSVIHRQNRAPMRVDIPA